ncbi:hypothetical protein [Salipiger thiooxidans]|uniref:hypothetical protein n=1 Tax=Salipiger thiooxidans TaxID=282683 RepID=UPI001CFB71F1|nr:hypothetical protein [Salipiger thiooxidans]
MEIAQKLPADEMKGEDQAALPRASALLISARIAETCSCVCSIRRTRRSYMRGLPVAFRHTAEAEMLVLSSNSFNSRRMS